MNQEFARTDESIENLTIKQGEIFTTLSEIQGEVNANKVAIVNLEEQISDLRRNVQQNNVIIQQKLNEHSVLIKENSIKLDVLAKYTFQGLKPAQQLAELENKNSIFGKDIPEDKRTELIGKLQRIVDAEGIIDVTNKVGQYAGGAYDALVSANIPKGEDAKRASKFLYYLMATTNVVTGAGSNRMQVI